MNKFEEKYFEDNPKLQLTLKKMVKAVSNGHYATFTEMSSMFDYHATAEKNDLWKSWVTSDEYLDVLTLRSK